jgi:hypothetical protein
MYMDCAWKREHTNAQFERSSVHDITDASFTQDLTVDRTALNIRLRSTEMCLFARNESNDITLILRRTREHEPNRKIDISGNTKQMTPPNQPPHALHPSNPSLLSVAQIPLARETVSKLRNPAHRHQWDSLSLPKRAAYRKACRKAYRKAYRKATADGHRGCRTTAPSSTSRASSRSYPCPPGGCKADST